MKVYTRNEASIKTKGRISIITLIAFLEAAEFAECRSPS